MRKLLLCHWFALCKLGKMLHNPTHEYSRDLQCVTAVVVLYMFKEKLGMDIS